MASKARDQATIQRSALVGMAVVSTLLACAPERRAVRAYPSPVPPPPATAAPVPPPAPSPFHIVAVTNFAYRLMTFDDATVAVGQYDGVFMPLVAGRAPALDERLFSRVVGSYSIHGVGGRLYGQGALATDFDPFVAGGGSQLYRRKGGRARWVGQQLQPSFVYVGTGRWYGGRHLALRVTSGYGRPAPYYRFEIIAGAPAATPRARVIGGLTGPGGPRRGLAVYPDRLIVRRSGEVLTVGQAQGTGSGDGLHVERFEPPALNSTIEALPMPARVQSCSVGAAADDGRSLWLVCGGEGGASMLVHDGKQWTRVALPDEAAAPHDSIGLSVEPDGTLWLAAGGLWRRREESWQRVPLPSDHGARIEVGDVHADGGGSIWVLGRSRSAHLVMHTRPTPRRAPPHLDARDSRVTCMYPTMTMEDRKPANDSCIEPFVLLRELAEASFETSAIADIVAALAGHRELVTAKARRVPCFVGQVVRTDAMRLVRVVEEGTAYFGARVPDTAMAKRVASLVGSALPRASPEVLCYRPDADAELVVDLSSGAIAGWQRDPNLAVYTRGGALLVPLH